MHFSSASLLFPLLASVSSFVTAVPVEDVPHELEARAVKEIAYDCSRTPQICLNTCWAINCRGLPKTLHGGGGLSDNEHRKEWGYYSKTQWDIYQWGGNTSPEEYPYASSKEGGLKGAGKTLSLRCVPQAEQSSQGGKTKGIRTMPTTDTIVSDISGFTNLAHLKTLTNPVTGAAYDWCETTSTCVNDGHQFTATSKAVFALS